MRLWSLHPAYLDRAGLGGCWREALLAQAVLAGRTTGYRNHPQLERFRSSGDPVGAIGSYLHHVWVEADCRGYTYDRSKIGASTDLTMTVTSGQLAYERDHLRTKLATRSPAWLATGPWADDNTLAHPIFTVVAGGVEAWERVRPGAAGESRIEAQPSTSEPS